MSSSNRNVRGGNRRRSYSENVSAPDLPEELAFITGLSDPVVHPKWCFTFSRAGRVTWRTGISSLLLLFLETYTTFDYRRFGISIDNQGYVQSREFCWVLLRRIILCCRRCCTQRIFPASARSSGTSAMLRCDSVRRRSNQTWAKHLQLFSHARGKLTSYCTHAFLT